MTPDHDDSCEYWVFGYGSLIWKPPPHVIESQPGFIKGYRRRFWQQSTDHRGTIEQPGRVVTLVKISEWQSLELTSWEEPIDDCTWGVAYRIDPKHIDNVKSILDYREKNGYATHHVNVYTVNGHIIPSIAYIGTLDNTEFVGPKPLHEIAQQIHTSIGPSGQNKEYLYNLAKCLRQLAPEARDDHLFSLEEQVRQLDNGRINTMETLNIEVLKTSNMVETVETIHTLETVKTSL